VVSENGVEKCFGIEVNFKRGDENCFLDHMVNEKGL
jgi:hypothetical protein